MRNELAAMEKIYTSMENSFHLIAIFDYESRGPSDDWFFLTFQWRPSWMLRKKSLVESTWHAVGTGQCAMLITSASPAANCFLSLPSKDTHAWPLLLNGTWTRSVTHSGNIKGRKDRECGQIGVKRIPGTCSLVKVSIVILNAIKVASHNIDHRPAITKNALKQHKTKCSKA